MVCTKRGRKTRTRTGVDKRHRAEQSVIATSRSFVRSSARAQPQLLALTGATMSRLLTREEIEALRGRRGHAGSARAISHRRGRGSGADHAGGDRPLQPGDPIQLDSPRGTRRDRRQRGDRSARRSRRCRRARGRPRPLLRAAVPWPAQPKGSRDEPPSPRRRRRGSPRPALRHRAASAAGTPRARTSLGPPTDIEVLAGPARPRTHARGRGSEGSGCSGIDIVPVDRARRPGLCRATVAVSDDPFGPIDAELARHSGFAHAPGPQ